MALVGFAGAALAGVAYFPQIWHLVSQRCSAGISRPAFAIWLLASLLVTVHAISIDAGAFIALGVVQVAATTTIVVCSTKYAGSLCEGHRSVLRPSTDGTDHAGSEEAHLQAGGL